MKIEKHVSFVEARAQKMLSEREKIGNKRVLPAFHRPAIDFCSNDYLGLARDVHLQATVSKHWSNYPQNGSTGSRLLSGNNQLIETLEAELATFFGAEASLFFSTGYMATLAVLSTLPQRGDTLLYDAHIHASVKDAARITYAHHLSFPHNDLSALRKKCMKFAQKPMFVVSEGLFSTVGDTPPLGELHALCEEMQAMLVLDEAHSTGIFGPQGKGLAYAQGLAKALPLRIHTFGKAWGTQGACVLGSRTLINYLINYARPFIYSTAPTPVQVHMLRAVLYRFQTDGMQSSIKTLQAHIEHFTQTANKHLPPSTCKAQIGPIQTLLIPGNIACKEAAHFLQAAGYDVMPILSPTVPIGSERLRICLHSYNTTSEITHLITHVKTYVQQRATA